MKRRDFLKFTTLGGIISAYPTIMLASANSDNFILGSEIKEAANSVVEEIFKTNDYYSKTKGPGFFEAFKKSQHPRVTVIGCSDSRFQMTSIDSTPENDLFVIRNIGNQFTSNEGSVEYGVHHLHTPLLLIVGHTRCGAIDAAMSDYSSESSSIRKEVDTLALSIKYTRSYAGGTKEDKWLAAVIQNVKMQTAYSIRSFAEEVKSGKLTVMGVVYDLANDLKDGHGKLKVIAINDEMDPEKLKSNGIIKALQKN
jgi:carbonic anhydrase